jgi:6-pyruvoyltetrahydropterin/6-carboxytetrahydropterin synthase
MMFLTRVEHFNAAHKLFNEAWSKEKNAEEFGKCANENWHGHNYELHVTVKGEVSADTGFVINAQTLSRLMSKFIIEELDHKNLNLDVEMMKGKLCSAENLAIAIWQQLILHLPKGVKMHSVKLFETPRIFVEYFGN